MLLERFPAVVLIGPRQVGKTTLAKKCGAQRDGIYLDLESQKDLQKLSDPEDYLSRHADRLVILDEIQRVPELTLAIKLAVDRDRRPGRFVLTGSANLLALPKLGDSLAGRMSIQQLQPLSESEKESQPRGIPRHVARRQN